MAKARMALVGATGNVGREIIRVLEEKDILLGDLVCLASKNSVEDILPFKETSFDVKDVADFDFKNLDIALFACPKAVAEVYIPKAVSAGVKVVDLSGVSAADMNVPLIAPLSNLETLAKDVKQVAVASVLPAQLSAVISAVQTKVAVENVVTTALLPTSFAGKWAMDELFGQSANLIGGAGAEAVEALEFKHQVAFNCIPHVGDFVGNTGVSDIEMQVLAETNRVLGSKIPVSATAVYVPTFIGASQSVTLSLKNTASVEELRKALEKAAGVMVIDKPEEAAYSTPFGAAETDYIYVSRIRKDPLNEKQISLWVVCDNLRRGAAMSAVDVAEKLLG